MYPQSSSVCGHLRQKCRPSAATGRRYGLLATAVLSVFCWGHIAAMRACAQAAPSTINERLYVRQMLLPAKGLAYDPVTKKLFASLPGSIGPDGNSVVEIDFVTAEMSKPFFVGSEPRMMEASRDGKYLYVILSGSKSVARVSLATRKVETIPVGDNAASIAVSPVDSSWFALVRGIDVTLFQNGVQARVKRAGSNSVAYSEDGKAVFGYDGASSSFGLVRYPTDSAGWAGSIDNHAGLIGGYGVRIKCANRRLYATNGTVIDCQKFTVLGQLPDAGGEVMVDPKVARVYYVKNNGTSSTGQNSGCTFRVYDPDKFVKLGELQLPLAQGDATDGQLLGDNRVAFLVNGSLVMISPEMDLVGACKARNWSEAQKLLLRGVNINCSDELGGTALMWCCYFGNQDLATQLLDRKADLLARDGREDTALGYAVASGNARVVDLLLRRGADPNLHGALGTPLKIATTLNRPDLIQMLTLAGGKL
jgi:hypothetical protein